jgi:tetratricopeptide (TPR) repeat protein
MQARARPGFKNALKTWKIRISVICLLTLDACNCLPCAGYCMQQLAGFSSFSGSDPYLFFLVMVKWFVMKAFGWIGLGLALLAAGPALADDTDQAKEHYLKGKALAEEGAYEKAVVELLASYDLNPIPIVLYNIAVSYDSLEQYAEAVKYYEKYLMDEKELSKGQKSKILKRIDTLRTYLGILDLSVDEDGAEVLVDDRLVGITPVKAVLIETGNHTLTLRKPGFLEIKKSFTIISEKTLSLKVTMDEAMVQETADGSGGKAQAKVHKAKGRKKLGPAAFAATMSLTAAAGVCAIALGATAVKKDDEIKGMFESENWKAVADERDRLSAAADAMIAVTAAAAVATIVLAVFTDFKKEKKPAAFVAPAGAGRGAMAGLSLSF